mgnify:CR=1 FL=1
MCIWVVALTRPCYQERLSSFSKGAHPKDIYLVLLLYVFHPLRSGPTGANCKSSRISLCLASLDGVTIACAVLSSLPLLCGAPPPPAVPFVCVFRLLTSL